MNVQLVVVGAHNGSKLFSTIEKTAKRGIVILVEPVEWLFAQLVERFKHLENVVFVNTAIVEKEGIENITFNAPKENANTFNTVADQLGSIKLKHAADSVAGIDDYFEEIEVPATTFRDLFEELQIDQINSLIIDTEGMDAILLSSFPFDKIKPYEIFFEFKHSDGTMRVGKNLANLLLTFVSLNYVIVPVDHENFYAVQQ